MSSSSPITTPALTASATPTSSSTSATQPATPADLDEDMDADLDDDDEPICTSLHAFYAFDTLVAYFAHREVIDPPFSNGNDKYGKPALTLRGCIGNFSPMAISHGLLEYALVSALKDHRFSPIRASELPHLSVSVSLLTPFTPVPTPLSWTPGVHGIHITFPHPAQPSTSLSATYLPEVVPEQGWTKEEAVLSLVRKAGYRGKIAVDDDVWKTIRMKVYGSVKAKASWEEYEAWSRGASIDQQMTKKNGATSAAAHHLSPRS